MSQATLALPQGSIVERLDRADYEYFRQVIFNLAGIALSDAKVELVQSRLRGRIAALGVAGFRGYREHLAALPASAPEWQLFINLMTTNKTEWFREAEHFTYLMQSYIPRWQEKARRPLSIWCAACSSGEEAYTLSLLLRHHFGPEFEYQITATDIDSNILARAANGVYPAARIKAEVPQEYWEGGFSFGSGAIQDWVKVRRQVKVALEFHRHNLVELPYQWQGKFDVIFCRNVLIYFAADTVHAVTEGMYACAAPSALLFIGHSESLQNRASSWRYVRPSVYVRGELR